MPQTKRDYPNDQFSKSAIARDDNQSNKQLAIHNFHLTDFDQVAPLFSNWQGQFEQLSTGRFDGTLHVVRGTIVRAVEVKANQSVLIRGHDAAALCSVYLVTPESAGGVWQGRSHIPGQLVVHGPEAEVDHRSARRPQNLSVSLSFEELESAVRSLLNTERNFIPRTRAILSPHPDLYASLQLRLQRLLNCKDVSSLLGTPEGDQIEQECVRALVTAITTCIDDVPLCTALPARVQLLRRAEELMRARLTIPMGVIELCEGLKTSDRTLRLAFRERYGLGPMAFYKRLRLNATRSHLKTNGTVAIAEAARVYGFHHLGNFAADYRRLFGERPSATQRCEL